MCESFITNYSQTVIGVCYFQNCGLHIISDFRVKKENEFNRPRIPVSLRKIKRTDTFISKKVYLRF